MFLEEDDIDTLLEIEGHQLTMNGVTVPCLVDQPDEELFDEQLAPLIGLSVVLTVHTGAIPSLAIASSGTVDGQAQVWHVHRFLQHGDGAITRMLVAKVG